MKYLSYLMMVLCACSLHAQRNISNTDGIVYSTPISVLDVMDMGTTGTITNAAGISSSGAVYFGGSFIKELYDDQPAIYDGLGNRTAVFRYGGSNSGLGLNSNGSLNFYSANIGNSNPDTFLYRDSAGTLAQRNGANAQTSRIYGTYADSSNYERLSLSHNGSGVGTIGVESGGSGSANQSLALKVAGNGALYVENPTYTAGNARGAGAVDFQLARGSADQVASGSYSVVIGNSNKADGDNTISVGGYGNWALQQYSSVLGGYNNKALAQFSSISGGRDNTANNFLASVVGGQYANAYLYGQHAYANGRFEANADAQGSRLVARNTTSGTTPADLFTNGSSEKLVLPNNTTWKFVAEISARSTDAGAGNEESAAYEISGLIERDSAAADTRIVGTPTVTTIAEDDAAWSVAASADTTSGALTITCTGNDETTVRWVAVVRLVEVGG